MISNKSKCEVCLETLHKYKCPVCLLKYCSVGCYKEHKEKESCIPKITAVSALETDKPTPQTNVSDFLLGENATADQVSLEKLKMLGQSDEVLHLLQNPHLRTLMQNLDKSENPTTSTDKAMHEPIFLEFVDACLNVVEPDRPMDVNK
ncbi:zinc finger HIT domain-containing protein 3-like [Lineus longissimus]|uniref:zinc finger HIT domain-containing protein 3-like n=1 Tax=Lineus longissimus TaxID=88925 RepID=UPI002B4CF3DC